MYYNEICKIKDCNNKISIKKDQLCPKHYSRKRKHGNPLIKKETGFKKGKNNINWNGGVSLYPNHSKMKKNRKIKLKQINYICERCKENKAVVIHHIDNSKDNHELSNLMGLCHECHGVLGRGRKNSKSKYKKIYGLTLNEISKKYNVATTKIYYLHKDKKLNECIKNNNFKLKESKSHCIHIKFKDYEFEKKINEYVKKNNLNKTSWVLSLIEKKLNFIYEDAFKYIFELLQGKKDNIKKAFEILDYFINEKDK